MSDELFGFGPAKKKGTLNSIERSQESCSKTIDIIKLQLKEAEEIVNDYLTLSITHNHLVSEKAREYQNKYKEK